MSFYRSYKKLETNDFGLLGTVEMYKEYLHYVTGLKNLMFTLKKLCIYNSKTVESVLFRTHS